MLTAVKGMEMPSYHSFRTHSLPNGGLQNTTYVSCVQNVEVASPHIFVKLQAVSQACSYGGSWHVHHPA